MISRLRTLFANINYYNLFILVVFVVPLLIVVKQGKAEDALDPSYMFSVNYAASHHLIFGTDIIITYGPLGCLAYVVSAGLSSSLLTFSIVMKVSYLVLFYFILIEIAERISRDQLKLISLITRFILFPWLVYKIGFYAEYSIIIFLCLIYCCVLCVSEGSGSVLSNFFLKRKKLLLVFTGFTIAILFFIKISYLPFILAVPFTIAVNFYSRKQTISILLLLGSIMFTFLFFYLVFKIDFKNYLINSLEVITGYKKAMQIYDHDNYHKYYILSVILILFFAFQLVYVESFAFLRKNFFVLSVVFLGIYFLFTYSFTRGYTGGLIFNPAFIIIFFYLVTLLSANKKLNARVNAIIMVTLLISFYDFAYPYNIISLVKPPAKEYIIYKPILEKYLDRSQTYDVYPYLTTLAYFNNLNYKFRPTVQSYTDYTPKLDVLTANFFKNKKVDNIIFHGTTSNSYFIFTKSNSIDKRYFLYEEPLTKIAIIENYDIKNQINDSLFIATKRLKSVKINLKLIGTSVLKLDEVYTIKGDSDKVYYFTADIKYTTKAKAIALVGKYPHIKADIELTSGKRLTFDVISDLLQNPCILNKYCENYNDMFKLADRATIPKVKNIKSIRFYSNTATGYQNEIKLKVFESIIN